MFYRVALEKKQVFDILTFYKNVVRNGIRTQVLRRGLRPGRGALDHSAILTV